MPRLLHIALFVLVLLGAVLCLYLAVVVELEVRAEVGSGLTRGLAQLLYDDAIRDYRRLVAWCAIGGTGLLLLAYLIRPFGRGGPGQSRVGG